MFTTPEDWVDRLIRAGGRIRVDAGTMYPVGEISPEQEAIWNEIRGYDNARWRPVEIYVRSLVGRFVGFADYPEHPAVSDLTPASIDPTAQSEASHSQS